MLRLFAATLTLLAGVALGLAATLASLRGPPPFGAIRSGAWTSWPDAGTAGADPYARALFAREGRLPLPTATGLRFFATSDDSGARLEGNCAYAVSGPMPAAQAWTLTVLDGQGLPVSSRDLRTGFTSAEVVRGTDGNATIVLARQARPGNWLPIKDADRFTLMLTAYDSPVGAALLAGNVAPPMPAIVRTACP